MTPNFAQNILFSGERLAPLSKSATKKSLPVRRADRSHVAENKRIPPYSMNARAVIALPTLPQAENLFFGKRLQKVG